MEETVPAAQRLGSALWPPSGWSLRTKISAVLLLPVIVALSLAGARIHTELDQASRLSVVRDQLPVVQGTVDLADLIGQEMVAAASGPAGTPPTAQINAVDAKMATLQHDADFSHLPADTGRGLNTALGRLSGLRAAGGDPIAEITGYRDIIYSLSDIVPGIITAAGSSDLNATANTARSLIELRAAVAVEAALVHTIGSARSASPALFAAATQVVSEESVIRGQVQREIDADRAARFTELTGSAPDRQAVLQSGLATGGRIPDVGPYLQPIVTEIAGLGDLLNQLVGSLSATITDQTNQARSTALRDTALVVGALLGALAIALVMARSLISPVRRLHAAALTVAHRRLPDTIERVHNGEEISWESVEPVGVQSGEEIGQLARAFDEMHRQAVRLAGEQAELRKQVSEMFMTLARRSQSMVELQLMVLEDLESNERDPQRLDDLFRLDHLATRLRRNGENLQVLAGGGPARRDHGPISMVEVLRGATSEVKDYRRVSLVNVPNGSVRAQAAADIVHILAELLENATRFSPPEEKVFLTADRGSDGGLLVEVVDNGLGMTAEDLAAANLRLATPHTVGPETARRMGLFVVGRLAGLHGVTVRLRPTMARSGRTGITASVHVPGELIIADGTPAQQPVVNGVSYGSRPTGRPSAAPPAARTPIFERVVSNWFTENGPDTPEPAKQSEAWVTAADDTRRAAESAVQQAAPAAAGPAGLPTRKPGAQLAPGAALPRQPTAGPEQSSGFRDATAVRNNLSRHYNGIRAARMRTAHEEGS